MSTASSDTDSMDEEWLESLFSMHLTRLEELEDAGLLIPPNPNAVADSVRLIHSRYICIFYITDTTSRPGDGHEAPARQDFIVSLSMKLDGTTARHRLHLPHCSMTIYLRWSHLSTSPAVRIQRFWQVPGHRHGLRVIHHNNVNLACLGPCEGTCNRASVDTLRLLGIELRRLGDDIDEATRIE